jgi:molybdate transport system permease protein
VARTGQAFSPLVAGLAAISALFFILPLTGLVIRAPWSAMTRVITSTTSLDALWLTLIASLATTALALVFGFPLAWLLARGSFRGQALLRGLTTLPMVLPPVVGGIALLLAYGRKGLIGEPLNSATGLSLPFTTAGVIVAEAFVAMPFFVITLESGCAR